MITWLPVAAGDGSSSEFSIQSEQVAADIMGYRMPGAQHLLGLGQQGRELLTCPGRVSRQVGHGGEDGLRPEGVWMLGAQNSLGLRY